jgi:hypothetical protein
MMGETRESARHATGVRTYQGSCHCGAIRFEVDLDLGAPVNRCNCSFCTKLATAMLTVKPTAFRLLSGEESVADYQRTAGGPNHGPFCKRCGAHAFGYGNLPELGGEYRAVNVNCLDGLEVSRLAYQYWDGRHDNWDAGPRSEPWPIIRASRAAGPRERGKQAEEEAPQAEEAGAASES